MFHLIQNGHVRGPKSGHLLFDHSGGRLVLQYVKGGKVIAEFTPTNHDLHCMEIEVRTAKRTDVPALAEIK